MLEIERKFLVKSECYKEQISGKNEGIKSMNQFDVKENLKIGKEYNSCLSCSKAFSCKQSLAIQIRSMHENIRFQCEMCRTTFGTKQD